MKILKETENAITMESNRGHIYEITCVYPDHNPVDAIQQITDAMAYAGLFEGIKDPFE